MYRVRLDGHEADALTDGDWVLEVAHRFRPVVTLLDPVLRGSRLNGFQLAQSIRSDAELAEVSLVANTGLTGSTDHKRAREAGFKHFLVKLTEPDKMLQLIDEVPCRQRDRRPGGRLASR